MWIPFKSSSCGRKESKVTLPGERCGESGTDRRELKWRRGRELRGVDAEAQGTEAQGDTEAQSGRAACILRKGILMSNWEEGVALNKRAFETGKHQLHRRH